MATLRTTCCCNPALLKYYRDKLSLTQDELGKKAGYSRRLITKAEAGKSISAETVADLATALSTDELKLTLEDLICDPVAMAKKYIDSFYCKQMQAIEAIAHFLHEDVIFDVQGDPKEIPFAGRFVGHAGVDQMIKNFFSVLEVPENYDHSGRYHYVGQGNEVIIWGECWIQPIGHPMQSPVEITIRMQFEHGKLKYFEDRYNIKAAAEGIAKLGRIIGVFKEYL